jgi:hypothetical protein
MPTQPSVGRVVHYTNAGDRDGQVPAADQQIIAALITKVNDDGTVALTTFYPTGQFDLPAVTFFDGAAGTEEARGKWAWPAGT